MRRRGSGGLGLATVVVAGLTGVAAAAEAGADGWFPFVMRGTDVAADSPVDVSFLNGGAAVRRIAVQGGRFVNDSGDRVRFLGTNVCFSGAFPEKDQAPAIARRLAQLGFNVVRFHHMDARDIWLPGGAALDPVKLDRLDWFIHHLKLNGIYSNINLHVSRTYPGLAEAGLPRAFRYGKILDKFHEPFIRLQEQYARDLLARVNPYTGLRLADDPAVAFVELNNENSLLQLNEAALAGLNQPDLRQSLRRLWGAWLAHRHPSPAAVQAAWNAGVTPLGDELLRNRGFTKPLDEWTLEGAAPGICAMEATGDGALHVRMTQPGKVSWAYQIHQHHLSLEEGQTYTIRLRGRSTPPRPVSVALRFAEPPWTVLNGNRVIDLREEWTDHTIVCSVSGLRPGLRLRFSVNLGDAAGEVWLAEPSLRPGQELFAVPSTVESVADLPLPEASTPPAGWVDFRRFLIDTELAYVKRLRQMLRQDLGVKPLIVDSQASYGGYWGLHREATLSDYIDMHAYWQHPVFPGRPWDPGDWHIGNTSMVAAADGGTFPRLAAYRHADMPFSVSEYNHPAPSDSAAEIFPLIAVLGAVQDWDALYQFSYANTVQGYAAERIGGYFELCHHAAQLVFAPLAALVFRQGLVSPAPSALTVTVPMPVLDDALRAGFAGPDVLLGRDRLPVWAMLGHRFAVRLAPAGGTEALVPAFSGAVPDGALLMLDQVQWRLGEHPAFTVVAPAARLALGHIGGTEVQLGDVVTRVDLPKGTWACMALVSADGKPVAESARLLLAVATRAENAGMLWDEARQSVGRNWGKEPVLAQGVPFVLQASGQAPRVHALDAQGDRAATVSIAGGDGAWTLRVDAAPSTLWYSLER